MEPPTNDFDLLRAASDGDEDSFVEFCSLRLPELRNAIKHYCYRYGLPGNREVVDDLTHEAMMVALEKAKQGKAPSREEFWLSEIGRYVVRKSRRGQVRSQPLPVQPFLPGRLTPGKTTELREELEHALRQLKYEQRLIVELTLVEEQTQEEIAQRLGISTRTVRRKYKQALARLRKILDREGA